MTDFREKVKIQKCVATAETAAAILVTCEDWDEPSSAVLQGALLLEGDFTEVQPMDAPALKGALIYCNPPYVPVSKTSDFTKYTSDGFTYADQLRLAIQAAYWRDTGAHVIFSQAADESLIDQYRRLGFRTDLVQAKRNINSKGTGRGPVGEYLIY